MALPLAALLAVRLAAAPALPFPPERLAALAAEPGRLLDDARVACHVAAVVPGHALPMIRAAFEHASSRGAGADGFWRFEGRFRGEPSGAVVELHPDGRVRASTYSAYASEDQLRRSWPSPGAPAADPAEIARACEQAAAAASDDARARASMLRCDGTGPAVGLARVTRRERLLRRREGCEAVDAACLEPGRTTLAAGDLVELVARRDGFACLRRERARQVEGGYLPLDALAEGERAAAGRAVQPPEAWWGSWYRNTPSPRAAVLEIVRGPRGLLMIHAEASDGALHASVVAEPYRLDGADAEPDGEVACPLRLRLYNDAIVIEDHAGRGCWPAGVTPAGVYYRNAKR